jgi:hypothetical protein
MNDYARWAGDSEGARMAGPTRGGTPEIGNQLDESQAAPAPKAFDYPLRRDTVRFPVTVRRGGMSLHGMARVSHRVNAAATYALVTGTALLAAAAVAGLCHLLHASGGTALVVAAASGGVSLLGGLTFISVRPPRG